MSAAGLNGGKCRGAQAGLGECDVDAACVLEHVIGRGELLQPEAALLAGVAEPVLRGQRHQDFHHDLPTIP
jgi:hypothetical protein